MNSTEKLIQEKKDQIKSFERISKNYPPNVADFTSIITRLKVEIADLVENLYKKRVKR